MIRRRIVHSCTMDEWRSPSHRAAAIRECWNLAIKHMPSDGGTFVSASPVVLWTDLVGQTKYADIRMPGSQVPIWIDSLGHNVFSPDLAGLTPHRTTYMDWAEGPLPYRGDEPTDAPDPLLDRDLQRVRHQNKALRGVFDSAIENARVKIARDVKWTGVVDFRVRGVFSFPTQRVLETKQGGGESKIILDGQAFGVTELHQGAA